MSTTTFSKGILNDKRATLYILKGGRTHLVSLLVNQGCRCHSLVVNHNLKGLVDIGIVMDTTSNNTHSEEAAPSQARQSDDTVAEPSERIDDRPQTMSEQDMTTLTQYKSFDDLNLRVPLLRGIYAYGFEQPSMIQQKAIKPIMDKREIIGQAQSGTGKTATFSIGILQNVIVESDSIQSIVLAPTRELADQIYHVICSLGSYLEVKIGKFIGGEPVRDNIYTLDRERPQIVVGTPGRILDLLEKRAMCPKNIDHFIIDEADEMLSRGFKDQIYQIFKFLPYHVRVGLFSATMAPDILDITKCFMENPVKILVKNDELTLEGIHQFYVYLEKDNWKFDTLCDLYEHVSINQSIIYCNKRRNVEYLYNKLTEEKHIVSCIHGEMDSGQRNQIMKKFRLGESRVLISTDLLARGIDVQQVSLVINYDIPNSIENYIHRIGRSGRFGRKGIGLNFVTPFEYRRMKDIERYYSTQIEPLPENFSDYLK